MQTRVYLLLMITRFFNVSSYLFFISSDLEESDSKENIYRQILQDY